MCWGSYFVVCFVVISIGFVFGLIMLLVLLCLESWGYGSFVIGVMVSMLVVGVLFGVMIVGCFVVCVGMLWLM